MSAAFAPALILSIAACVLCYWMGWAFGWYSRGAREDCEWRRRQEESAEACAAYVEAWPGLPAPAGVQKRRKRGRDQLARELRERFGK